jgi:hypothetical protein
MAILGPGEVVRQTIDLLYKIHGFLPDQEILVVFGCLKVPPVVMFDRVSICNTVRGASFPKSLLESFFADYRLLTTGYRPL